MPSRVLPKHVGRAAWADDLLAVALWLDQDGGNINALDRSEADLIPGTLLMNAAAAGSPAVVQDLIARGCALDLEAENGWTALEFAGYHGKYSVISLLLDAGAELGDVHSLAAESKHPLVMSQLMRHSSKLCWGCGRPGAKKRCAQCVEEKLVPAYCFCSEECMRRSWPDHMRWHRPVSFCGIQRTPWLHWLEYRMLTCLKSVAAFLMCAALFTATHLPLAGLLLWHVVTGMLFLWPDASMVTFGLIPVYFFYCQKKTLFTWTTPVAWILFARSLWLTIAGPPALCWHWCDAVESIEPADEDWLWAFWSYLGQLVWTMLPVMTMYYAFTASCVLADCNMMAFAWAGGGPLRLYMKLHPYLLDKNRKWGSLVTVLPVHGVTYYYDLGYRAWLPQAATLVTAFVYSSGGDEEVEPVWVFAAAGWLLWVPSEVTLTWTGFVVQLLVLFMLNLFFDMWHSRVLSKTEWRRQHALKIFVVVFALSSLLVFDARLCVALLACTAIGPTSAAIGALMKDWKIGKAGSEAVEHASMLLLARVESAADTLVRLGGWADCRRVATSAAGACVSAILAGPMALLAWHRARREQAANEAMGELTSAEEARKGKAAQRKDKAAERRRAAAAAAAAAVAAALDEEEAAAAAKKEEKEVSKAADRAKSRAKKEDAARARAKEEMARQKAADAARAKAEAAAKAAAEEAAAHAAAEAAEEAAAEAAWVQALGRRRRLERAAKGAAPPPLLPLTGAGGAAAPPAVTGVQHHIETSTAPAPAPAPAPAQAPAPAPELPGVPYEFCCPLTHDIMHDPAQTVDGLAYERTAIAEWLARSQTSPLTGAPLASTLLIDCVPLRGQIRRFLEQHPELAPPPL